MKHMDRKTADAVSCGLPSQNIPVQYKTTDPYEVTCPKCLVNMINTLTKIHSDVTGLSNP
jgi:hypothetical protein